MNKQETLEKISKSWNQLTLREQQAVAVGGVLLFVFLFYQCIWKPCLNHLEDMRHAISSGQKTLLVMQAADKVMQAKSEAVTRHKSLSLVALLSQMQKQITLAGLAPSLSQLKQSTNESIEMHFQKVEFDKLITFLIDAMNEYTVSISQMSVVALDAPGMVNADVVLNRVLGE